MNEKNEVKEILKAANIYLKRLEDIHRKVQNAEQQVCSTSQDTKKNVKETFSNLKDNLTKILDDRCNELIKHVQETKLQSLSPLSECRTDIAGRIKATINLVKRGENILSGSVDDLDKFNQESSLLGSLPEIPELKEVPYITFQYEPQTEIALLDLCSHIGEVSRIAPVQISQMSEKPGSILVEWQIIDNDEKTTDIQEFRLQRAFGDVLRNTHLISNFTDCFIGLETQFLVKDLRANQPYSFRVCCKFEGCNDWSPWSVTQVTSTSLPPLSWKSNPDYILTNDNKIACPVTSSPSVLLSDGNEFSIGCSVEFTYLELDEKDSILGLIMGQDFDTLNEMKSSNHSYFALSSIGEIYVDGVKKSTKLPEATKGLKVCFTCEFVNEDKVRVNIDSSEKRVTYDWHIPRKSKLYFAAQLKSTGSKIMVE